MAYIEPEEFCNIVIENNYNAKDVRTAIAQKYPTYTVSTSQIENRIATYVKTGKLPLKFSGATISPGEVLKGVTTTFDGSGNIKRQSVRTEVPKEANKLDVFAEAITTILEDVKPVKAVKAPKVSNKDLMAVYTIGDAHVGMLAWEPETGQDHNLDTVLTNHQKAMKLLVDSSPDAKEAFIVDVGDFFHSDNMENKTARSGNALDVDGRYPKVLEMGLKLTINLIDSALRKHQTVNWRSAIGNHNEHSAIMINLYLKAWYRNEPRVVIHDTPNMFMYYKFGKNLIGITHGHTTKAMNLGSIMSVDCKELWSETEFRYWYTGHIHHDSVKEFPNCKVESFRTLTSKDAWHSASGYRSEQDMKCIILHKNFGEISRNTVNIRQLQ